MVEKKLLTLAGVLGILGCGACFLPPLPQPKPAPPHVRTGLDGVQSIRVEVVNSSPSHHLDSADLAQKIAETINQQSWKAKINAHVEKEEKDEDAVLIINVVSETVVPAPPSKTGRRTFLIKDSAKLTRLDGTQVWWESEAVNWITHHIDEEKTADAWKVPDLVDDVNRALAARLVLRMFYEH
jgi:hypothetical protein